MTAPYTQPPPFHSQWGEDRWLVENCTIPLMGTFVDIGAGDGIRGSNTLYFENLGWTGLCVDPDPRNYSSLSRRHCQVQTCAVSATPGNRRFGMYRHKPSWSGLERFGAEYIHIVVTARTLDDLLLDTGIARIDLLSIDVEGTELDVWASFDDTRYQPAIVIIEFDENDPGRTRNAIRTALGPNYALVHRTPANLVFARGDRHAKERVDGPPVLGGNVLPSAHWSTRAALGCPAPRRPEGPGERPLPR